MVQHECSSASVFAINSLQSMEFRLRSHLSGMKQIRIKSLSVLHCISRKTWKTQAGLSSVYQCPLCPEIDQKYRSLTAWRHYHFKSVKYCCCCSVFVVIKFQVSPLKRCVLYYTGFKRMCTVLRCWSYPFLQCIVGDRKQKRITADPFLFYPRLVKP